MAGATRRAKVASIGADVAAAVALTLWYYRGGLRHFADSLYDTFDQKEAIYLLEWIHHSMFGSGHLRQIFDPNIFYPHREVLAWTETFLGFAPFYSLARAFTANQVLALNLSAAACVFLASVAALRLGRELSGRFAFIAAAAGPAGMLAAGQEGHFQLKAMWLFIVALLLVVRSVRARPLSLSLLALACEWLFLSSLYLSVMLAVLVVTAGVLAALGAPRASWTAVRAGVRRAQPWALLLAVAAGGFACAIVARHYVHVAHQFRGGYDVREFIPFSARAGSLFDASPASAWYRPRYGDWGSHESRLFFGVSVWLGALLLAFPGARQRVPVGGRAVAFFAFGALTSVVLAFGPLQREALEHGHRVWMPAAVYFNLFPGFKALRTIGRFALCAAIFMAVLAELGVRALTALFKSPRGRGAAYAAAAGLVLADQTTRLLPTHIDLLPRRQRYQAIARTTPPDAVVLELPVGVPGHLENLSYWMDEMLGSTRHWRRIVAGYSGHESQELAALLYSWRLCEAGKEPLAQFFAETRRLGVTSVLLDSDRMAPAFAAAVEKELEAEGSRESRVEGDGAAAIFALPR